MGEKSIWKPSLDRYSRHLVSIGVAISVLITLLRFSPGIPLSVDTTSHLYRVVFLSEWLRKGIFPFWSPDWYAGSPTLLLYPPLGYFMSVGLSLLGVDSIISYKIVDAFFYCAAPVSLFFLAKEFGFSRGEAGLSAILYSLVPEVIENYFFYDRFPNVIAIPIFCAFIVTFHRSLLRSDRSVELLASILLMSSLLLTHHLSALIAAMVAILVIVTERQKIQQTKLITTLLIIAGGTLAISGFWFIPFIRSIGLFAGNNFYNRNVIFPFISLSYFTVNVVVYLLGLVQFALTVGALHLIFSKVYMNRIRLPFLGFFTLILVGMAVYQMGTLLGNSLLALTGQSVVILSFACFLAQAVLLHTIQGISGKSGVLIIVFWFIIFLWVGLGYYALPILWLPYVREIWIRTMDVYRIWLYLALPMSALASKGVMKAFSAARRPVTVLILLLLLTIPMVAGVLLKVNYAFTSSVNGVLPYTAANAEIPNQLIDYLRNDSSPGRILGINVPFWIYLLPNYVGKPIVDGWYPQTKLIVPLVNVNDYRIDDLETTPSSERVTVWGTLIADSSTLDITWVLIGGRGLANQLMTGGSFAEELSIRYRDVNGFIDLILFKARSVPSFVSFSSSVVSLGNASQPNPDRIVLTFKAVNSSVTTIIKEAYYPTWKATVDGQPLQVTRQNSTGYIQVTVPAGAEKVIFYQDPDEGIWNTISSLSILACCFGFVFCVVRRMRL